MIPLFLDEEEENSSMARQQVFRERNDPLECYDDLELFQRFRFSRSSISRITELTATHLNTTERFHAAPPHLQICAALQCFASGTFQIICGDGVQLVSLLIVAVFKMLHYNYKRYTTSSSACQAQLRKQKSNKIFMNLVISLVC